MRSPAGYEFNGYRIPDYMVEPIEQWIEHGIPAGGFLTAVLENDLRGAVGRADAVNLANLPAFVAYFYNEAPSACWGSPAKVKAWRQI